MKEMSCIAGCERYMSQSCEFNTDSLVECSRLSEEERAQLEYPSKKERDE